jgi:hypothetical protein
MSKSTVIEDLPLPDDGEDEIEQVQMPPVYPAPIHHTQTQTQHTQTAAPSWQTMILSQDFLKAVFLAFVVIAAVTIAPLDEYVFKYAPFLANAPRAPELVKAFVAAAVITFLRPPVGVTTSLR